jgi:hypothetical protein
MTICDWYDVIPSTTIYLFIRINSFSLISVLTYHLTKFKDTKRETKSRFLVGLYHGLERTTTYGNQGSDLGQAQTCGEVKPVNKSKIPQSNLIILNPDRTCSWITGSKSMVSS